MGLGVSLSLVLAAGFYFIKGTSLEEDLKNVPAQTWMALGVGVLIFIVWATFYVLVLDRLFRAIMGKIFGVTIVLRRALANSVAWEAIPEGGFWRDSFISVLFYAFAIPFLAGFALLEIWVIYRLIH